MAQSRSKQAKSKAARASSPPSSVVGPGTDVRPRVLKLCDQYQAMGGSDDEFHALLVEVAKEFKQLDGTRRELVLLNLRGGAPGTVLGDRRAELREVLRGVK